MHNYDEMTDFQVAKLVAETLGYEVTGGGINEKIYVRKSDETDLELFSPIHNPSDAWPIIVDNGISILSPCNTCDKWSAGSGREEIAYEGDFYPTMHEDANPLRAAMIVFLMMQESKDA